MFWNQQKEKFHLIYPCSPQKKDFYNHFKTLSDTIFLEIEKEKKLNNTELL